MEWAEHNINVNSVSPITTLTPMALKWLEDIGVSVEENAKWIPLKRANQPEDIANAVLFLASPESHNITGQDIIVDGGITVVYWPKG